MERLQVYAAAMTPQARMTLGKQRDLIAQIKANPLPQWRPGVRPLAIRQVTPISAGVKIGRNEPCPCGSGKKFKKCGCGLAG